MLSTDEDDAEELDADGVRGERDVRSPWTIHCPSHHGPLLPASIWRGTQSTADLSYDVAVRFHHIDLERTWTASGLLRIERPTAPALTIEFDAEIVGPVHGFCRPAKQTGGFHERELAAWARLDKFSDVEASLRFEQVADDQPTMTLDGARERPYLFMRLRARGPSPRALATVDGAYYVCLAWHGDPVRAVDASPSTADPLTTPVRKPTLRRASASSHLTPFSWASVVAGRPTSPSPPASPTLPLAGLPETPEVQLKVTSEAVGCAALVESTSALDISADDFPAPPISPRLSRPQRRRAASSSSFVPPTRSVSRSADLPRYTGAFADATLSGLYVSSDGSDKLALSFVGCGPAHDTTPRRTAVCSSATYTIL